MSAKVIAVLSQKGGVGKSTLSRAIAREYAANDWDVLIADMDTSQKTSTEWNGRRVDWNIEPFITVQPYPSVKQALKKKDAFDLVVFDGAPLSSEQTKEMARISDLVLLPTGVTLDDLRPQIKLAHQLVKDGIEKKKIRFVFTKVGASASQLEAAINYILDLESPYQILDGHIPDKDGYRLAMDDGKALTETPYKSLNEKADKVIQSIMDALQ